MRKQPVQPPPAKAKTLPEQKRDFTSEGSPPPGKVAGGTGPVTAPDLLPETKRQQS